MPYISKKSCTLIIWRLHIHVSRSFCKGADGSFSPGIPTLLSREVPRSRRVVREEANLHQRSCYIIHRYRITFYRKLCQTETPVSTKGKLDGFCLLPVAPEFLVLTFSASSLLMMSHFYIVFLLFFFHPLVGYVVGLGDRHVQNILVDCNTAELVHIDLGKKKKTNLCEVLSLKILTNKQTN